MSQQPAVFDFDAMADSYDEWYETRLGRMYDALEKKAVAGMLPNPRSGDRLLDVGCGTGHWSAFFSLQGFRVTGVDVSPRMIAVAREKRIPNARFEIADAHAPPFEDGQFGVVAAVTTLEFVSDAEAVVREMARCARRPGGVILVGALNALAGVNIRRKAEGQPPYAHARFFSPAQLRALLVPYGKAEAAVTTFVPHAAWALPLAPIVEFAARALRSRRGAFVVGKVIL